MILKQLANPMAAVAVGTFAAWTLLPLLDDLVFLALPTSRWMEVESIEVGSVRVGQEVPLRLKRTVHRPFTASWTATLQAEAIDGYMPYCTWSGHNDFRPDILLPSQTTLRWFFEHPSNECPGLTPGRYILTIVWTVEAEGLPARAIRADSKVFEILP